MKENLELLKTQIHGLDQVLGGGLLKGRLYLINGVAGSGKTILGNQLVFSNAQQGYNSLFVSLKRYHDAGDERA